MISMPSGYRVPPRSISDADIVGRKEPEGCPPLLEEKPSGIAFAAEWRAFHPVQWPGTMMSGDREVISSTVRSTISSKRHTAEVKTSDEAVNVVKPRDSPCVM
jgi:hypothetical protein